MAYAAHSSKAVFLLLCHTTLLEISCRGSYSMRIWRFGQAPCWYMLLTVLRRCFFCCVFIVCCCFQRVSWVGGYVRSLFCSVALGVLSSLVNILLMKRELVALLYFFFCGCLWSVSLSMCCGLACSLWLWHFLVILIYLL